MSTQCPLESSLRRRKDARAALVGLLGLRAGWLAVAEAVLLGVGTQPVGPTLAAFAVPAGKGGAERGVPLADLRRSAAVATGRAPDGVEVQRQRPAAGVLADDPVDIDRLARLDTVDAAHRELGSAGARHIAGVRLLERRVVVDVTRELVAVGTGPRQL